MDITSKRDRRQVPGSQVARYSWRLTPRGRGVPMCLSYIVEGDLIRLPLKPGGVRFDFPIGDMIETEEAIVICLQVPEGKGCKENVYALDHDGNLLWRIRPQCLDARDGPYVGLSFHRDFVRVHGADGRTYDVHPATGSLLGAEIL